MCGDFSISDCREMILRLFKWINDKVNTSYETQIAKSKKEILNFVSKKKSDYKWYDPFFESTIDYSEFKIINESIEILRVPKVYWPFRSHGRIRFIFLEKTEFNTTRMICEILPGDNTIPYVLIYMVLTLGGLLHLVFFC